jgi:hydrogenase maturation protease
MARVLVLGYGNSLRSDDGLGWQAAVEMARTNLSPDVTILPCHQLTPDLAEPVQRADTVIFLDCAREGDAGDVRCRELAPEAVPISLTHDLSPSALLALASELYGVCPRAYLLTICGESYAPGEMLSPKVSRQLPELKEMARRLIETSFPQTSSVLCGSP